jgi:hypothetical protein
MLTPQQYIEHHNSRTYDAKLPDSEIERITDQCLRETSAEQEIVFVHFETPGSATRCQEIYSQHYTCEVDGQGVTVEIRVPRIGKVKRREIDIDEGNRG